MIEKIRKEVEKLKSQLIMGACASQTAMETRCKEEAYNEVLAILDSMQEEPVGEDLEKAAEQDACEVVNTCSATGIPNDHIPSWVQDAMINEFIHGAKWKEQQMMAKAVDGSCYSECGEQKVVKTGDIKFDGLHCGDKVKLIVIKQE